MLHQHSLVSYLPLLHSVIWVLHQLLSADFLPLSSEKLLFDDFLPLSSEELMFAYFLPSSTEELVFADFLPLSSEEQLGELFIIKVHSSSRIGPSNKGERLEKSHRL